MEMTENKGQVGGTMGAVLGFVFLVIGVLQISVPILNNIVGGSTGNLSTTSQSILNSTQVILALSVLVGGAVLFVTGGRR